MLNVAFGVTKRTKIVATRHVSWSQIYKNASGIFAAVALVYAGGTYRIPADPLAEFETASGGKMERGGKEEEHAETVTSCAPQPLNPGHAAVGNDLLLRRHMMVSFCLCRVRKNGPLLKV